MNNQKYDVTIIGGGHNGLVAATYLAKVGKSQSQIVGYGVSIPADPRPLYPILYATCFISVNLQRYVSHHRSNNLDLLLWLPLIYHQKRV